MKKFDFHTFIYTFHKDCIINPSKKYPQEYSHRIAMKKDSPQFTDHECEVIIRLYKQYLTFDVANDNAINILIILLRHLEWHHHLFHFKNTSKL